MIRRPPRSTRTDTLFPYTTLFRSAGRVAEVQGHGLAIDGNALAIDRDLEILPVDTRGPVRGRVERLTKLAVDIASPGRLGGGDQRAERRQLRSEERRGGKECVSTSRFGWSASR